MIYFILSRDANLVKIGYSGDVEKRLKNLRAACPVELDLIACIEGDGLLERQLHTYFFSAHVRNEWFQYTVDLASEIERLRNGHFDYAILPKKALRSWALEHRKSGAKIGSNGRMRKSFAIPASAWARAA